MRSNSLATDPRVEKETVSLAKNNYQVIILAWDRENSFPPLEMTKDSVLIKRFKLSAPYGKITILSYLPLFWLWSIIELLILDPEIVHACDLDTAIPAYVYKLSKKGAFFVFDVFDRYAMAYIPQNHRVIYFLGNLTEELLASKADLFITVSESFLRTFIRFRIKFSVIIQNTPRKADIKKVSEKEYFQPDQTFRIYMSHITKETLLMERAVKEVPDVEIVITGRVLSREIAKEVLSSPRVRYFGITSYEEALKVENSADLIAIIYDPSAPLSQHRLAGCNRLFEAMMLKKPIITNIADEFVIEKLANCTIVDYNWNSIRSAVTSIVGDSREKKNVNNIRYFEGEEYCWEATEKLLIESYGQLKRAHSKILDEKP